MKLSKIKLTKHYYPQFNVHEDSFWVCYEMNHGHYIRLGDTVRGPYQELQLLSWGRQRWGEVTNLYNELAYSYKLSGRYGVYVRGEDFSGLDSVYGFTCSGNRASYAFAYKHDGRWYAQVNDRKYGGYEYLVGVPVTRGYNSLQGPIIEFSDDGSHYCFAYNAGGEADSLGRIIGGRWFVQGDGGLYGAYAHIAFFNIDRLGNVYIVTGENGNYRFIVNGRVRAEYDQPNLNTLNTCTVGYQRSQPNTFAYPRSTTVLTILGANYGLAYSSHVGRYVLCNDNIYGPYAHVEYSITTDNKAYIAYIKDRYCCIQRVK